MLDLTAALTELDLLNLEEDNFAPSTFENIDDYLNGNTIRLFESWDAWEKLRKEHSRYSTSLFIRDILKVHSSVYYRKRRTVKQREHLWPQYLEYKAQKEQRLLEETQQ